MAATRSFLFETLSPTASRSRNRFCLANAIAPPIDSFALVCRRHLGGSLVLVHPGLYRLAVAGGSAAATATAVASADLVLHFRIHLGNAHDFSGRVGHSLGLVSDIFWRRPGTFFGIFGV